MIGAIEVHPARSHLGFPFDPLGDFAGRPLLARTVEAALACPEVETLAVLVPAAARGAVEGALSSSVQAPAPASGARPDSGRGRRWRVIGCEGEDLPARGRLRRLRRLAPASWRAGWAIPYAVAEAGNPRWLLLALERLRGERLMLFPQAAPFLDSGLVGEAIVGAARNPSSLAHISTAPPGLAGDVFHRALLEESARLGAPLDAGMRFLPDHPERALENRGVFHWFAAGVSGFTARLTAESRRGLETLRAVDRYLEGERMAGGGPRGPAGTGGRWLDRLSARPDILAGPIPPEVRVWITSRTRDPSPVDLAPRDPDEPDGGGAGPADLDPALFRRIALELGRWEECRIVISGGEPLLHPRLPEILEAARASGAGVVEVETDGRGLDGPLLDRVALGADVVRVALDAARPETYSALRGAGALTEAEAGVGALLDRSAAAGGSPVVAVELRVVEENRDEVERFFDRWYPRTPFVVVRGASDRAGQLPTRPLHAARTPERIPCLRLGESLSVLPSGAAVACENGFRGGLRVGDLRRQTVAEVWTGPVLARLREAHHQRRWDVDPLCARCGDWCRR